MVEIVYSEKFKRNVRKIKDIKTREKLQKLAAKIINQPTIGKPMRFARKQTREVYMTPYRLAYAYEKDTIRFIQLYHKDEQ